VLARPSDKGGLESRQSVGK